jgi:hypothetical protein
VAALKLVKLPWVGLPAMAKVSVSPSLSLAVSVPSLAVFSSVLRDWPSATGVVVSTTVIVTVASVLVFLPSEAVKVKLS